MPFIIQKIEKNMKNTIISLTFSLFLMSCGSDTTTSKSSQKDNNTSTKVEKSEAQNIKLPKYKTVREMLKSASDFDEDNNTLKFISENENNLHVQVSKPIFEKDLEQVKMDIVKRDIIYVAFQTFAQTDVKQITVTAIPVMQDNYKKYVGKYKKTVKLEREKAKKVMMKYLSSEDFSILYELDKGFWLPSKNFSKLKFENLNEVFNSISTN
jgi:hypothetical protein